MEQKNKQIIRYILEKIPGVSKTALIKTVYLADCEARKHTGKSISKFNYIRYHYGPYDFDYQSVLEEEIFTENIIEKDLVFSSGRRGKTYYTNENKKLETSSLTPVEIYILNHVIENIREKTSKPLEAILDEVYQTEPMQNAEMGNLLKKMAANIRRLLLIGIQV